MSMAVVLKKFKYAIALLLLVSVSVAVLLISKKIVINNRDGFEGIFFLKGEEGVWLAITDDLYPFESPLLLGKVATPWIKSVKSSGSCTPHGGSCREYQWNEKTGRGYIKARFNNNNMLIIGLGRFISAYTGKPVSGLFVGGGIPATDPDFQKDNNNESGMTYFDGSRWFHIWCNVNEGIIDSDGKIVLPSTWDFVSSRLLESSPQQLTIVSRHRLLLKNTPMTVERYLFYKTGNSYITLNTTITNKGNVPASFSYVYGDEPWLGNYYTFSKGNIGWYAGGLVKVESNIDTKANSYVGMFDYGNDLIGESHHFTGKANFLEWFPESRPDNAYFSNAIGKGAEASQNVPLSSYKNRVVFLEWEPRVLQPGESFTFALNVGMAFSDPITGFPFKPDTTGTFDDQDSK